LAAKWAAQNSHLLPIDPRPVAPPSDAGKASPARPAEEATPLPHPELEDSSHPAADPWSEKIVIDSEG